MQPLEHFRTLSTNLDAERIAFNAAQSNLLERINVAASVVARIEEAKGDATKQRAELRRLKVERANLKAPSFVDPLPDLEAYTRTRPNTIAAEPVTIAVPNGQTPLAVHNICTEKTNRVIAEIGRVIAAPPEDMAGAIAARIDAIATSPRIVNGELVFPKHVVDSNGMAVTVTNTEGLFAWLHRDAMIAAMQKLAASNGPGLTAAERGEKLASLYVKLTTALRSEAAAAMAAEQAGQRVIRRRHVHPAILLGVKVAPAAVYDWLMKKRGA
jgi:hypothetical protein